MGFCIDNGYLATKTVSLKELTGSDQTVKADNGKLEISLCPTQIIRDITEVRMYGNAKYHSADNWKLVEKERYINALLRHTLAFIDDENGIDEESGIPHYRHMACNLAFLCEMMKKDGKCGNDEPKQGVGESRQ